MQGYEQRDGLDFQISNGPQLPSELKPLGDEFRRVIHDPAHALFSRGYETGQLLFDYGQYVMAVNDAEDEQLPVIRSLLQRSYPHTTFQLENDPKSGRKMLTVPKSLVNEVRDKYPELSLSSVSCNI